jgi:hypothetical protein
MENQNNESPYDFPQESVPDRYKRAMSMDKQQVRTLDKKHLFLIAFEKYHRNITRACEEAGIDSRKTFYNWRDTDPEFKKAIDPETQMKFDMIEDLIMMKIFKNHGPTIRWWISKHHPDYKRKRRSKMIGHGVPFNPFKKYQNRPRGT